MLSGYLALLLALYALAIGSELSTGTMWANARGEIISAGLCVVGLAIVVCLPLRGRQYDVVVFCMCTAPVTALLFHDEPVAQIWSLIPLLFAVVYLRTWHSTAASRVVAGLIALGAVAGLLIAPAEVPMLWLLLFVVCIMGAGEVFGSMNSALLDAALTDPLTALWNRAGLDRQAQQLVARAQRRGEGAAVIAFDVDDFKRINDRDGHQAGDAVLVDLARRWTEALPPAAALGRVGGDEFVVFLTGCDESEARLLADRLARARRDQAVRVTYGVAVGAPTPDAFTRLLGEADQELYRHKRLRKDLVD